VDKSEASSKISNMEMVENGMELKNAETGIKSDENPLKTT